MADDSTRLCRMLEDEIRGDVDYTHGKVSYYSADASAYTARPLVVVTPADIDDVAVAVRVAAQTQTPIVPRGGGTGLVGGALGLGIILDMARFCSIRASDGTVEAGAGTPAGRIADALGALHEPAMLGPNPSVGPFCTIGGMIGCNAAGSRSLKYGCTIDNVQDITMIDGRGDTVRLPCRDGDWHSTRIAHGILGIARGADTTRFPRVSKNASGYRLDSVTSVSSAHRAVVGSEGTLGVVVSARLRTVRRPSSRVLCMLEYAAYEDAAADCMRITAGVSGLSSQEALHPAAVEFADRTIISNMKHGFGIHTVCVLLVEYDDNHAGSRYHPTEKEMSRISPRAVGRTYITDEREISEVWSHRDSALHYSIRAIDQGTEDLVPHIIEDAAVPQGMLHVVFAALCSIDKRYGSRTVTYGHAGNGNIHVRLILGKNKKNDQMGRITAEYFATITAAGGTITGEHGDGMARTEFVPLQYGGRNMRQFARLKGMFDPHHIMNPSKIVPMH